MKIKNLKAFTLLEILIAFGILAVIVPLFLFSLPQASQADRISRAKTSAIYLAQEKLEEYLSYSYADIPIGMIEAKSALTEVEFSRFQREVSTIWVDEDYNQADFDTGLKKITVTIYWQENGRDYQEALNSLKVQP